MKKKAMVSQPMAGKTDAEVVGAREKAVAELEGMGYEVVPSLFAFTDEVLDALEVKNASLYLLASSIQAMSRCNSVYFAEGWEAARGCRIEHDAAVAYGLEVLYEDQ